MSRLAAQGLDPDPFEQFRLWLADAAVAGLREPTACALATTTASALGRPSARMVLLKGFDERGFVFATHYESRKGRELAANPAAALVFYWDVVERQVRIEGIVERTAADESDAIFAARPRGARLGAWASPQSERIAGREELERRVSELERQHPSDVPRPPFWGGFRLVPDQLEFWQGQPHRLHDRFDYRRGPDGRWLIARLAP